MNEHTAFNEDRPFALPPATRSALLEMMQATGDRRLPAQVIDAAVKAWLRDTGLADPEAAVEAARGYQWKSLFLPDGTLLRAEYHGEYYEAQVRGDHIEYQGRRYSPRQLLLYITGNVRNAWREFWIRCPGDARWHLANTRRRILRRDPSPDISIASTTRAWEAAGAAPPVSPWSALAEKLKREQETRRLINLHLYLHRGDMVRDDQPNLTLHAPGGRDCGPLSAGRAGPRERRSFTFPHHGEPPPGCARP